MKVSVFARRAARGQPYRPVAYSVFWLAWVLAGVLAEVVALASREPGASLSAHWWRWVTGYAYPASIPRSAALVGRAVTIAFLGWLIAHFAFHVP